MEKDALMIICRLIIIFFIFSIIGWMIEVTLKYRQFHKFVNRGFLIGPYCPIYGWGVVADTILVGGIICRNGTVAETFFAGFVVCGILEYFTSWYMERFFHARWWDYSKKPMNLNGRIWIGNLILFGIASVLIVKILDPSLIKWLRTISPFITKISALSITVLILTDYTISHFMLGIVRKCIDLQNGDNSEEIREEVHKLLKNRTLLERYIKQAYPNWQPRPRRKK